MKPGNAAICFSKVSHVRQSPKEHKFINRLTQIWIDPDKPAELFKNRFIWSLNRFSPARFKQSDYLLGKGGSMNTTIRDLLEQQLGKKYSGPIRMLSQPRLWFWLFNPITIYFIWSNDDQLEAALLEVTNTPWKERHHYAVELEKTDDNTWTSEFKKEMHVSPFLEMPYNYQLTVKSYNASEFRVLLNLVDQLQQNKPKLLTNLKVNMLEPTNSHLSKAIYTRPFSTHMTSFSIHFQALRLWLKRVPFVKHPSKKGAQV